MNGAFVSPAATDATSFISNLAKASYDGRTWTTIATVANANTQDVREIAYGNGHYIFVGEFDIYTGTTTVSPGGVSSPPPAITAQPVATQSAAIGGSVTFSITVTGTGVTYQWYFNGVAISGAINVSYTLGSITAGNAGSYTVTVTNAGGTITSSASVLTVTAAPNTRKPEEEPMQVYLTSQAAMTVSDSDHFVLRNGKRYHDGLDPRTGMPAEGTVQATVIGSDPTMAGAMAHALLVLGPKAGLAMLAHD